MTADIRHVFKSPRPDLVIPDVPVHRFLWEALDSHVQAGFGHKPAFLEAGRPERVLCFDQIKPQCAKVCLAYPLFIGSGA